MSAATGTVSTRTNRHLWWALVVSELRVFLRQPIMLALALLVPAALLGIAGIAELAAPAEIWASGAGRNTAAVMCITVYFIALNTITARRHTLALKRLRTTALPDVGIVSGLLVAPILIGLFQIAVVTAGLMLIGAPAGQPAPASPALLVLSGVTGVVIAALAGLVTSALTANPEKAQWTMLPLFVGAMGAVSLLPSVTDPLGTIAMRLVPLVANADMTTAAWLFDGDLSRVGIDAAIIVIWLLLLGLLSMRTFRWERRR